jgi:ribosomal protein L32
MNNTDRRIENDTKKGWKMNSIVATGHWLVANYVCCTTGHILIVSRFFFALHREVLYVFTLHITAHITQGHICSVVLLFSLFSQNKRKEEKATDRVQAAHLSKCIDPHQAAKVDHFALVMGN